MDITIVQFKRHYILVCMMVAFSLAGIFLGYRQFLLARVFTMSDIGSAYGVSFLFFLALGVVLPQWLLKAIFLSEQHKPAGKSEAVNTLPTGRADLQPVTLVISGVCLAISVVVVIAVFMQPIFSSVRAWLYGSFYLDLNFWIGDSLLVFLFTGLIWLLTGFLLAMFYRMVLSLTTQTGVYQTLEQRFYLLLFGGGVFGLFFWNFLAGYLVNTRLLVIMALVPLVVSAFWLPLVFSRSTERSYIKHFELKTGVRERNYFSRNSVCFCIFAGSMLTGAYLPLLWHIERLSAFNWIVSRYFQPLMLLVVLCGWYYAFRRDISGRQRESGIIIPLYRWAGSCLGTVFVLALIMRQQWHGSSLAILLWYVFAMSGLFFLGDMLFNLRLLMARALPSMTLGLVLWVVMSCLGWVWGGLLFGNILLNMAGSLVVLIMLFFGGVIATGVTIIFTSPQEHWHQRVILLCIMPIVISTLVIFWITHNWLLKEQGSVTGYYETPDNTWLIRQYDNASWFERMPGQMSQGGYAGPMSWGMQLRDALAAISVKKVLISGDALSIVPYLDDKMAKDIVLTDGGVLAKLPNLQQAAGIWGIDNTYLAFEQVTTDRWKKYDLIWLDPLSLTEHSWENPYFWHKLLSQVSPKGVLLIGCAGNQNEPVVKRLHHCLTIIADPAQTDISMTQPPPTPQTNSPAYTIIKISRK